MVAKFRDDWRDRSRAVYSILLQEAWKSSESSQLAARITKWARAYHEKQVITFVGYTCWSLPVMDARKFVMK
jgi:hypothetical protein